MADIFLRGIGIGMGTMMVYKFLRDYSKKSKYVSTN